MKFENRSFLEVENPEEGVRNGSTSSGTVGCGKEELFLGQGTVYGKFALRLGFVGFEELG